MRLLKLLLILFVCTAAVSPVWAQRAFDDAKAAYNKDDYATALRLWRPLAEQGHAGAQNSLGGMYATGRGVAQAYVQAHMWFNLAAAQGDADAIKYRKAVAAKMTAAQIAEAQRGPRAQRRLRRRTPRYGRWSAKFRPVASRR